MSVVLARSAVTHVSYPELASRFADSAFPKPRREGGPQDSARFSTTGLLKLAVSILDAGVVSVAMMAAYALRRLDGSVALGADRHLLVVAVSVPVWVLVFSRYRLYSGLGVADRPGEFRQLAHACAAGVVAMTVVSFGLGAVVVPRGWLALTFPAALTLTWAEREIVHRGVRALRRRGWLSLPTLIVGANAEGCALANLLQRDRSLGRSVVGFADDITTPHPGLPAGLTVLGAVAEVVEIARRSGAHFVLVAVTAVGSEVANRLVRELTDCGFHVELSSALSDISLERLSLHRLGRFPLVHVAAVRRTGWRPVAKRIFDVVVAAAALVVGAPLMALIALAVKLDSPGPVLFRQRRVGRHGVAFEMIKFRTMVVDAEDRLCSLVRSSGDVSPLFKLPQDPRITRVGRVLRKFSVDELPQLYNVLRGEMGLVGPRPALPSEIAEWGPELHHRLRVAPGITGVWQVSGRSNLPFEDYVRLDRYYVDNWSLGTDLAILAKTIPCVLFCRGAY